jgi:hypothetical protein
MRAALSGACMLMLAWPVLAGEDPGAGADGAWAQRVQILYDAEARSVMRKVVRVWDPHPHLNLDFVWEPAPGQSPESTVAADGTVNGKGKLVWRVRGSASYDPATVYSTYEGELKDGRPHGAGRLQVRNGELFEGLWVAGRLEGQGTHRDEEGNRYEGNFAGGLRNGKGRLSTRTGEVFEGSFVSGLKHGKGRTRLAGGTVYESEWVKGREVGGARPDALADALVSGLLKAQAGGGDAGKVEIGVVIDDRMTQRSDVQYQHLVRDEDIAIYPVSEDFNNAWNGTGELLYYDLYEGIDWENAPAFAEVDLRTTDKKRVKLEGLQLKVAASEAYRKPMLSVSPHLGCVGYRPDFSIVNNGWGEVKDMTMSIRFIREGEVEATGLDEGVVEAQAGDEASSRTFTHQIGSFGDGTDVNIDGVFAQAGVDTAKLETSRFSCPSMDSMNVCRAKVANEVGFGELADFIGGEGQTVSITGIGDLAYSWSDDAGNTYQQKESFRLQLALAYIETPEQTAECGDGFGGSPEAMRYHNIEFPIGKYDYAIDLPVRGNRNLDAYTARLKMWSSMSSIHRFAVSARFADGSVRESKPVSFFYFRPKESKFQSKAEPASCYLPREVKGCG